MSRVVHGGVSLLATLALLGSTAATAGEPEVTKDGLMRFPNVRVVAAPMTQPAASIASPGLLAFRDPDTGEFRAPTAEEAAQLQQVTPQTGQSRIAQPSAFTTMSGGRAMRMDESQMPYSVVSRQPDGSLVEVCVESAEEAAAVVNRRPAGTTTAQRAGGFK